MCEPDEPDRAGVLCLGRARAAWCAAAAPCFETVSEAAKAAFSSPRVVVCVACVGLKGGRGAAEEPLGCLCAAVHAQPGLSMGLSGRGSVLLASAHQTSPRAAVGTLVELSSDGARARCENATCATCVIVGSVFF